MSAEVMTKQEQTSSIAQKLVAAMKAVDAVTKRGRNDIQKYNYVKAADVANEVRKALAEAGIAFTYSVISERYWESQTKNGTTNFFCSLMIAVTFTDADSQQSVTANAIGWGADTQDKAPYKAMTGALKYALRMNFLIPDESDPENGEETESTSANHPQQQPRVRFVTAKQAESFRNTCRATGKEPGWVTSCLQQQGISSSAQIPAEKFEDWMEWAKS